MEDNSKEIPTIKNSKSINWKDQDFPQWFKSDVEVEPKRGWKIIFGRGRTRYEDYFISQLRSIYMDLDGVLADFVQGYKQQFDRDAYEDDSFTINQFCRQNPHFFRFLPVIPQGLELPS